ncbi:MAG: hypothetical protein K0S72_1486 [Arthrobacter sp.]|nr:hypothetical protein [Arthrobacter sp.]
MPSAVSAKLWRRRLKGSTTKLWLWVPRAGETREDVQVSAPAGLEEAWTSHGFEGRFDLPLPQGDTGYGHTSQQVDLVRAPRELLLDYHDAVHRQTVKFLDGLSDEDLERVIDTRWNPPVTLGVRLVSTLADCLQHVGQAAYVRGLNLPQG